MSWLKKLFGKGDEEPMQSDAMAAATPPAGDSMQNEEERARAREQMEKEMEEAKQARSAE